MKKIEIRTNKNEELLVKENTILPLPINEELLIFSGFEKNPNGYYIRRRLRTIRVEYDGKSFIWNVNVDNNDISKVKYAHELKRIIIALNV